MCISVGLSQDCSSVQCPEVETCPEGTETLLLNSTNSEDIYDECCIAFECRPSKLYLSLSLQLNVNSDNEGKTIRYKPIITI